MVPGTTHPQSQNRNRKTMSTPETARQLKGDASMVKRLKTLENALKILMGEIDHLGHWIPDPCRRLVDDALANDKNQPTSGG